MCKNKRILKAKKKMNGGDGLESRVAKLERELKAASFSRMIICAFVGGLVVKIFF
jgi:hypothetical protein